MLQSNLTVFVLKEAFSNTKRTCVVEIYILTKTTSAHCCSHFKTLQNISNIYSVICKTHRSLSMHCPQLTVFLLFFLPHLKLAHLRTKQMSSLLHSPIQVTVEVSKFEFQLT